MQPSRWLVRWSLEISGWAFAELCITGISQYRFFGNSAGKHLLHLCKLICKTGAADFLWSCTKFVNPAGSKILVCFSQGQWLSLDESNCLFLCRMCMQSSCNCNLEEQKKDMNREGFSGREFHLFPCRTIFKPLISFVNSYHFFELFWNTIWKRFWQHFWGLKFVLQNWCWASSACGITAGGTACVFFARVLTSNWSRTRFLSWKCIYQCSTCICRC